MSSESTVRPPYFDTPARAERLQLLLHLVRNAGEVIYLRAPSGAGKTRFTRRLLEIIGSDTAAVWVRGGLDSDIAAVTADQLGLAPEEVAHWPDGLFEATGDQDLLFVVDDADQLDLPAVERLAAMHAHGGRLLLVGRGGLAHTTREWDVQFVDLPPFDAAETAAFLRSQAGSGADRISDDLAPALHRAAQGLPGPLLDALKEVLDRPAKKAVARRAAAAAPNGSGWRAWRWLAGGAAVAAVAAVLLLQDRINAFFEGGAAPPPVVLADRADGTEAVGDMASAPGPEQETEVVPASGQAQVAVAPGSQEPVGLDGAADPVASDALETANPDRLAASDPDAPATEPASAGAPAEAAVAPALAVAAVEGEEGVGSEVSHDPLEAVMRDALAAAEGEAPAGPQPVRQDTARAAAPAAESRNATASPVAKAAVGDAVEAKPAPTPVKAAVSAETTASTPAPVAEPAVPPPAPVEEREVPAPARAATPPPATKAAPSDRAKVASATVTGDGSDWLKSRPPRHYTLQLVGARDRAGVEKFIRAHGLPQPYAIFERQLDGRPWYSLVAGEYPDRGTAIAAKERLPKGLDRKGIWPRTFESIVESL